MPTKRTGSEQHGKNVSVGETASAKATPDSAHIEQLKLEINIRLEEYKALRAEIVASLSSSHASTNLTLTAAGILIAGSPFIIQYHAVILFLIASYCFFLIAWIQLHYVHVVFSLSQHIITVVAPKIRVALKQITPTNNEAFSDLLNWELAGRTSGAWAVPLQAARFLFPIWVGGASAIGFLINAGQLGNAWWQPYLVRLGAGSTIALFLYSLFLTYRIGTLSRYYTRVK
jgi:hypothetical protein